VFEILEPDPAPMTNPEAGRSFLIAALFSGLHDPIQIARQIQHARGIRLGVLGLEIELPLDQFICRHCSEQISPSLIPL
jgi:hypothetical protein